MEPTGLHATKCFSESGNMSPHKSLTDVSFSFLSVLKAEQLIVGSYGFCNYMACELQTKPKSANIAHRYPKLA